MSVNMKLTLYNHKSFHYILPNIVFINIIKIFLLYNIYLL